MAQVGIRKPNLQKLNRNLSNFSLKSSQSRNSKGTQVNEKTGRIELSQPEEVDGSKLVKLVIHTTTIDSKGVPNPKQETLETHYNSGLMSKENPKKQLATFKSPYQEGLGVYLTGKKEVQSESDQIQSKQSKQLSRNRKYENFQGKNSKISKTFSHTKRTSTEIQPYSTGGIVATGAYQAPGIASPADLKLQNLKKLNTQKSATGPVQIGKIILHRGKPGKSLAKRSSNISSALGGKKLSKVNSETQTLEDEDLGGNEQEPDYGAIGYSNYNFKKEQSGSKSKGKQAQSMLHTPPPAHVIPKPSFELLPTLSQGISMANSPKQRQIDVKEGIRPQIEIKGISEVKESVEEPTFRGSGQRQILAELLETCPDTARHYETKSKRKDIRLASQDVTVRGRGLPQVPRPNYTRNQSQESLGIFRNRILKEKFCPESGTSLNRNSSRFNVGNHLPNLQGMLDQTPGQRNLDLVPTQMILEGSNSPKSRLSTMSFQSLASDAQLKLGYLMKSRQGVGIQLHPRVHGEIHKSRETQESGIQCNAASVHEDSEGPFMILGEYNSQEDLGEKQGDGVETQRTQMVTNPDELVQRVYKGTRGIKTKKKVGGLQSILKGIMQKDESACYYQNAVNEYINYKNQQFN